MKKYGFVYIWYDRKHKRYYVGCHWGQENDGYVCSSPWMKQAYKIRPQDFKRRIIKTNISSREQTYIEEQHYFDMIKPEELRKRYYNLNIKNNNIWHKYDEKMKSLSEKISAKTKEAMQRPEVREKYMEGLKTRDTKSSNIEVREKRRVSMIGKNVSKDNSKAVQISAKLRRGVALSEEHKQNIKNGLLAASKKSK